MPKKCMTKMWFGTSTIKKWQSNKYVIRVALAAGIGQIVNKFLEKFKNPNYWIWTHHLWITFQKYGPISQNPDRFSKIAVCTLTSMKLSIKIYFQKNMKNLRTLRPYIKFAKTHRLKISWGNDVRTQVDSPSIPISRVNTYV